MSSGALTVRITGIPDAEASSGQLSGRWTLSTMWTTSGLTVRRSLTKNRDAGEFESEGAEAAVMAQVPKHSAGTP
jgi:hypothetical protein